MGYEIRSWLPSSVTTESNPTMIVEALTAKNNEFNSIIVTKDLSISKQSIRQVIKKLGLKPWHPSLVQELNENDHAKSFAFFENFHDKFLIHPMLFF